MVREFNVERQSVMASLIAFLVLSVTIVAASGVHGSLEESLKYWETLSMSDIKRRIVKRDATSQYPVEQRVTFDSYGRQFSLVLRKDFSVFSPGFKILVFEGDGTSHRLHLDLNIYRGIVQGDEKSFVSAYFNDNNVLSASIHTASELYVVEPAGNLNPNATNDTMIIYRESDLRPDNSSRCGYVNAERDELEPITDQLIINESQNSRPKRACRNTAKNTCTMYLAADPKFVKNIGNNDLRDTANKMVSVIDKIDQIYRKHQFDDCDSGFGFEVKKIHLFPEATEGFPYTKSGTFGYNKFLEIFSNDDSLSRVCLGHIFTYQSFADGPGFVLGLAFTASPDAGVRGGICSIYPVQRNTGFTSYISRNPITELQALLVSAHEIGHNWGAPHDTEGAEICYPPSSEGGKYVMYPVSVGGEDDNNYLFSPCSKTAIGRVLQAKSTCFVEKKSAFCGNYQIDPEETCDPGFSVSGDGDQCCDSDCKLRPNSACSDLNNVCCKNCKVIPASEDLICYRTSKDLCKLDSKCDGHKNCPLSVSKPDGTECFNRGRCRNGSCETLCVNHGYRTCSCEAEKDACKRCCVDKKGSCFPLLIKGTSQLQLDGVPCVYGICNAKGQCMRISRSPVVRLWDLLDLSSPSGFAKFMRNNFVWTILLASLIIWVPVSCFVCYLDRRASKERKTLINEVVEEELNGQRPASPPTSPKSPTSPQPKGQRAVVRRAKQKENIRKVVKNAA